MLDVADENASETLRAPHHGEQSTRELRLPELEYVERFRIGRRFCLLEPARTATVQRTESVQISPRRTADAFVLDDGDTIVVVDRKLDPIPPGITGVLLRKVDRTIWQFHARLQAFRAHMQEAPNGIANDIENSWAERFRFRTERADENGKVSLGDEGLRPPQIGALHAIGMHWSIRPEELATIVMPTGTGKTETMLCATVNYRAGPTLVTVPSDALRSQTARKFRTLGLLRLLQVVDPALKNPVVAVVTGEPTSAADLKIMDGCNVVIGVMASLAANSVSPLFPEIAAKVRTLFVDEAHHVPSETWTGFRTAFRTHRIVQFTATPFRLDGKLVDGRVVFDYPLGAAQRDGYFKPIHFRSIYNVDQGEAREEIAQEAVRILRRDLGAGLDHLVMARCANIKAGDEVRAIYARLAPTFRPTLVHSKMSDAELAGQLDQLRQGRSRIVVCVNMLGEGFDLPQLKIAALHDLHKSLPVLLQFTGRFTRSAADRIGDATVIANIADRNVSAKLERLYSENADWNLLLNELSSKEARDHADLIDFLQTSVDLLEAEDVEGLRVSKSSLRPRFSTIVYRCQTFSPKRFHLGLPEATRVHAAWLNTPASLLYFVTRKDDRVKWSKGKNVLDRQWDLFVLHHDAEAGLLHVNSSDNETLHELLATAVGATERISGEDVFRSLGGINRLIFNNIGVKKHGRRNMSFAMYTGADVQEALTITERAGATKSNLDGRGWENGQIVAPGCSAKGRVWSKSQGSILDFAKWCKPIGHKLLDSSIDLSTILKNVLIPEEVKDRFPDGVILSVEWPGETLRKSDDQLIIIDGEIETPSTFCEWSAEPDLSDETRLSFRLTSLQGTLDRVVHLVLDTTRGYRFEVEGSELVVRFGRTPVSLATYLNDYPLLVRYVDLRELEGAILYKPYQAVDLRLDDRDLEAWDWHGVDIEVESTWKSGIERPNSIQSRVASHFAEEGFDVVFNDDDAGEAADLVCFKEDADRVHVNLIHCKYSGRSTAGERVKDVVEVCSQAVRSAVWRGNIERLHKHLVTRQKVFGSGGPGRSRFVKGGNQKLTDIVRAARMKPVRFEIIIVQPGVRKGSLTDHQSLVLGSASEFLRQTVDVRPRIICSG